MLLPALSKVREKAKEAGCRNNLKQISLAWFNYSQDNDDYILGMVYDDRPDGKPLQWAEYMMRRQLVPSNRVDVKGTLYYVSNLLLCPSNANPSSSWNWYPLYTSYGYNCFLGPVVTSDLSLGSKNMWAKLSQKNPFISKTSLWADKWTCFGDDGFIPKYSSSSDSWNGVKSQRSHLYTSIGIDRAHSNGANNLYADGHVDTANYALVYNSFMNIWDAPDENALKEIWYNH